MQAGPVNSEGAPSAGVGTQVGSGPLEELRGTSGSFTLGVAVERGLLSGGPQVLFCNLSQLQGEEVHLSFWALGGYTRWWWPCWETSGHHQPQPRETSPRKLPQPLPSCLCALRPTTHTLLGCPSLLLPNYYFGKLCTAEGEKIRGREESRTLWNEAFKAQASCGSSPKPPMHQMLFPLPAHLPRAQEDRLGG